LDLERVIEDERALSRALEDEALSEDVIQSAYKRQCG